jgi:hypothetical protein
MVLASLVAPGTTVHAVELSDIGMCHGRSDPSLLLIAHARPAGSIPKYVLNVWTDPNGIPTGSLIVGSRSDQLVVEGWCRVWQHIPGQPQAGSCQEEIPDGATIAHAVGLGLLADGRSVVVRTDVRATDEGSFFRVRYREPGATHQETAIDGESGCSDGGGCSGDDGHDDGCDGSWTRLPDEGWYELRKLKIRSTDWVD